MKKEQNIKNKNHLQKKIKWIKLTGNEKEKLRHGIWQWVYQYPCTWGSRHKKVGGQEALGKKWSRSSPNAT